MFTIFCSRFDIVRKLGQGTYGKVQLGINKKTGQEVAIKTIKKCKIESEADLVRIRREVQIMSSVRHPNIVHIYEGNTLNSHCNRSTAASWLAISQQDCVSMETSGVEASRWIRYLLRSSSLRFSESWKP